MYTIDQISKMDFRDLYYQMFIYLIQYDINYNKYLYALSLGYRPEEIDRRFGDVDQRKMMPLLSSLPSYTIKRWSHG